MPILARRIVLAIIAFAACRGSAQTVSDYFVFKGVLYSQTSTATPTQLNGAGYYFNVGINGSNLGSISPAPSFTGPSTPQTNLQLVSGRWDYKSPYYSSQAALDAAFPSSSTTPYNLTIPGITSGVGLQLGPDQYPATIPKLTNTDLTWSGGELIVNANTSTTFNFSLFNEYAGAAPGNPNYRQVFAFFPESGSAPPWLINRSSFGDTWDDSYTLNAGSFTAGVRYRVVLTFDIYSDFDSTSVPGAEGVAMYSRQLQFYMNAIPEPSTVALIAGCVTLVAALYLRRRKSA